MFDWLFVLAAVFVVAAVVCAFGGKAVIKAVRDFADKIRLWFGKPPQA